MNHAEDPKDTLASLRELPTEVSLQQVEQMVAAFPLAMGAMAWLIHTLKFNLNTVVMTSSASLLVATSMYLLSGGTSSGTAAAIDLHDASPVEMTSTGVTVAGELPAVVLDPPASKKQVTTAPVPTIDPDTMPPAPPAPIEAPLPTKALTPQVPVPTPPDPATALGKNAPVPGKRPSGNERHYDLRGFTEVQLLSSVDANVEIGEFSVTATGSDELLDLLDVRVQGNVLRISFPGSRNRLRGDNDVHCLVRMPMVKALRVSGSGGITASTLPNTTSLDIAVLGSGQVMVGLVEQVRKLDLLIEGSGGINLAHLAEVHDLRMNVLGSGGIVLAKADRVGSVNALLKGSGGIHAPKVHVQGVCEVNMMGSGNVMLAGNTDILKVMLMGSGNAHLNELNVQQGGEVDLLGTGDVFVARGAPLQLTTKGTGTIHTTGSTGKKGPRGVGSGEQ